MPEQRHVFRLSRSLVVAVPRVVQRHLGVKRGQAVYWFTRRTGEAVLTKDAARVGGPPEGIALRRQLDAALAEIERLKQRNEARDRSMYAEGYSVGHRQATETLLRPHGASAERQRQRRLRAYIFPDAVEQERRAKRRAVEATPGPDQYAPTPGTSARRAPTPRAGGATTAETKPPALPVEK